MRTIHIIDTSVYLVILKVPNHYTEDQFRDTSEKLTQYVYNNDYLLLPFGTIIETGNHIADSLNGRRYGLIKKFIADIKAAIHDQTPYQLCGIPQVKNTNAQILQWLETFRDYAQSGASFADSMCIHAFNEQCKMYPYDRVRIWTYDRDHLKGYDSRPDSV